MATRGVLYVHAALSAVCPHIEWAAAGVLGMPINLDWIPQPAEPGTLRTELSWQGEPGTAAALASALRGWQRVRYEVTEERSPGCDGARYSYTPTLGMFHAVTGVHGDVLVPEDRLKAVVAQALATSRPNGAGAEGGVADAGGEGAGEEPAGEARLADAVAGVLGQPWDDELEPFRHAGEGAPVRWLHQVV